MTVKRLLLLIVGLTLIVPAWPAWLGWQSERQLSAYQGGRMGDLVLSHQLQHFERGWMRSDARSHVRVSSASGTLEFPVRHRIRHGYGRVEVESEPVYPAEVAERLAALFGDRTPLSVSTRLGARGDTAEIRVQSPAFDAPLPDDPDTHMRSAGLDGLFLLEGRRLRGSIRLPAFSLRDPESRISATDQVVELDLADPGSRVADARLEYRVESVEVHVPDQPPARLEKLRLISSQARQGGSLHLAMELGFGALTVAGRETGNGDLRMRVGPLHAETFDRMLRDIEAAGRDSEDSRELAGAALLQALPGLLAESPEVNLDTLSVRMPGGRLELALHAGFDGEGFETGHEDPLQRLTLTGRLEAGRDLARELAGEIALAFMGGSAAEVTPETRRLLAGPMGQGVIQGLVEQGYLVAGEDHYRADLKVEDRRLSLNGVDRSEWLYLLLAHLFAADGFN